MLLLKRVFSLLFFFSLFLSTSTFAFSAESRTVTTIETSVFEEIDEGTSLQVIPAGTPVTILERLMSQTLVRTETMEGYVRNADLVTATSRYVLRETVPVVTTETRYAKQSAPVFEKPETGDPIRYTELAETLTVAGDIDGYARLQTSDGCAYVALNFIIHRGNKKTVHLLE